jgi:hypothetical protein
VLVWSGLAVAALSARQSEPVAALAEAEPAHPFQARWDDATLADQPLLKKQDRLPLATVADVVVTERIKPPAPDAPVSVPPVILVQDDDDKSPPASRHRRQHAEVNTCTKHHMRKVVVRGGKSWRCRK